MIRTPSMPKMASSKSLPTYSCNKSASCGCGENDVQISMSRIVGGEDAVPHSWPMIISFRNEQGQHTCGGAILDELHVVTAAHCLKVPLLSHLRRFSIGVGLHNRSDSSGVVRRIKRFFIHEKFNMTPSISDHDIAILQLTRRLDLGPKFRATRTCRPSVNVSMSHTPYPPNNTRVMIVGWGAQRHLVSQLPEMLQQAQTFLIDDDYPTCSKYLLHPPSQFCAGLHQGGKGS